MYRIYKVKICKSEFIKFAEVFYDVLNNSWVRDARELAIKTQIVTFVSAGAIDLTILHRL